MTPTCRGAPACEQGRGETALVDPVDEFSQPHAVTLDSRRRPSDPCHRLAPAPRARQARSPRAHGRHARCRRVESAHARDPARAAKPQAARLAARRAVPARAGRRHRPDRCSRRTGPRARRPPSSRVTAALLFGVSALYHRGTLGPAGGGGAAAPRPRQHLPDHRRHATRRSRCCCCPPARRGCCSGSSGPGALGRRRLPGAAGSARPRWLYVPVYVALGWVAVVLPAGLLRAGGGRGARPRGRRRRCSTPLGGVVYGIKRPNP